MREWLRVFRGVIKYGLRPESHLLAVLDFGYGLDARVSVPASQWPRLLGLDESPALGRGAPFDKNSIARAT